MSYKGIFARNRAIALLTFYLKIGHVTDGSEWTSDNDAEVAEIIDQISIVVRERIKDEKFNK